jgi:hypothetical protein
MKKRYLLFPSLAGVALAAGLAGCASSSHQTNTEGTLYMDARQAVLSADRSAAPECNDRHLTHTEIVTPPEMVATPFTSSGLATPPGERRFSRSVERWTIERCGKTVPYLVTFAPNDNGQTDISVTPEG